MTESNHHHEKCRELFERLSEYLDRELDEETCSEIEAHIGRCEPCKVCTETLKRTVDVCRNLKQEQVPPDFSRHLRQLIGQLAEGGSGKRS